MRARMLAMLAAALAIAACNDASPPTGLSSNDGVAVLPEAHFNGSSDYGPKQGGHEDHDQGKKSGHGDHEDGECHDDDHGGGDRHHSNHSRKHGHYDHRWDERGHDHYKVSLHAKGRHDDDDDDNCGNGGGATTGSITGTVLNDGQGANGYPLFLLSSDGATVVATTNTTADGSGTYTFAAVNAGSYLLCEANPFTPEWGMRAETVPKSGPSCTGTAYAPLGYSVTVTGGATSSGNNFSNFGLE